MKENWKDNWQIWLRVALFVAVLIWNLIYFIAGVDLDNMSSDLSVVMNTFAVVLILLYVANEIVSFVILLGEKFAQFDNDPKDLAEAKELVADFKKLVRDVKTEGFLIFLPVAVMVVILTLPNGPDMELWLLAIVGVMSAVQWYLNARQLS